MMVNVSNNGAVYEHRSEIVKAGVALPIAIEVAHTAYICKNHHKEMGEVFREKCRFVKESFTPKDGETAAQARRRIGKNVALTLLALGALGMASFAAFYMLPTALAISFALTLIVLTGKTMLNYQDCKEKVHRYLVESFTKRPDETKQQAIKRISRNVAITLLFTTATVAGLTYLPLTQFIPIASYLFAVGMLSKQAYTNRDSLSCAFSKKSGETKKEAALRITKNAALLLLGASTLLLVLATIPNISTQLSSLLEGGAWPTLEGTKKLILFEYLALSFVHLIQSIQYAIGINCVSGK